MYSFDKDLWHVRTRATSDTQYDDKEQEEKRK